MKLVTFVRNDRTRHGVLVGEEVVDINAAFAAVEGLSPTEVAERYGADMLGLVERNEVTMPALRALLSRELPASVRHPLAEVALLAPIPRPPSMRDGYAFRQHVETARRNRGLEMIPEFDEFPVFYFTNHQAVVGPGDFRVLPRHLEKLDFELEACVVVGKRGRNVKASEADAYVFGLAIMNDLSARTLQMEEMKLSLGPAKGKDFGTAIGPWLVTLDELEDRTTKTDKGNVYDLAMKAWVNGVQVSSGNVNQMNWTFAQILERASYGVDLYPGDVIGSGTVGTGCFLELNGSGITKNQWLQLGDSVVLEIERLGRLENRPVAEGV
jgi:fumarylacetoacetate (FAA) hydrolase